MQGEPEVTYEQVEALVDKVEMKNGRALVRFRCTRTDHTTSSRVPVDLTSDTGSMIKTGIFVVLISLIKSMIFRRLGLRRGRGMGRHRRMGMGMGMGRRRRRRGSLLGSSTDMMPLTGKAREQAVVNAFKKVQNQFMWNEELQLWVHPEYERQQM